MKSNLFTTLAVALLAVIVVATAGLSLTYVRYVRVMQELEISANRVTQNINLVQALAGEAVEYSHRNPAMKKLLESVGIRVNPNAVPSASKTPAK